MSNIRFDLISSDEYKKIIRKCRLKPGEIWEDSVIGHKVACFDATDPEKIKELFKKEKSTLAIHDPPYNFVALDIKDINEYINWCKRWINNTYNILSDNSSLYVWLGGNQDDHFSPLPEFILTMRELNLFKSKSFITMRNQRGFGTQKNWMSVRQECLYYIKGNPEFTVQYTDIPKVLKGYYKKINGKKTENIERSKSEFIRPGNVWFDIQQVFYKLEENIEGCYVQKPIKSIERIILASSKKNDLVTDFFCHSGTTLIASEINDRKCFTIDINPIFCEIAIRRLEYYRQTGYKGMGNKNPFDIKERGVMRI